MRKFNLAALALTLAAAPARAEDWPQWLGPRRDATSTETLPAWSGAPKVLWRQPVGEGHSSPVVAGGKVYLHARVGDTLQEAAMAFDAGTGEKLWETSYERAKFVNPFGNGPRATPAVAGGKVYSLGITGILTCLDAGTGKQLWQVPTLEEFGAKQLFFGASCSPLVTGGKVLVNVGGPEASVVAFDADTGEVAWKALGDPASYASPILLGESGPAVFLTGASVAALSPADGSVVWQVPFKDALQESAVTPVRLGGRLLVSSIKSGSLCLSLGAGGESAEKAWAAPALTGYFTTPVPAGEGHFYHVTGEAKLFGARATLNCVESATGEVAWKKGDMGSYHAGMVKLADGKVLMLDDAGELILLGGGAEKYEELARSKVCRDTWAHTAVSGGRVYLRDGKELLCLGFGG